MHPLIPQPHSLDTEVESLVRTHGRSRDVLLPILQELGARRGGLSRETLIEVARSIGVPFKCPEELASFYALLSKTVDQRKVIRLCDGIVCALKDAAQCRDAFEAELADSEQWRVTRSSCLGLCDRAPAAFIEGRQCGPLTPENCDQLCSGWSGNVPNYAEPRPGETRLMLARAGRSDPLSIDDAIAHGAYEGLRRALDKSPEAVIADIETVGVRGLGGAGFPTGRKWRMAAASEREPRTIVCNADESEPLAFKDRVLLESDPHGVIEGMLLAAYAVGAREGIIYIRGEYEPQAQILEAALTAARERGLLGAAINGTAFSFDIELHRGAGAYICGEETALLESLEGRRGEPRTRPPYPTTNGYHGRPTVVNNVETLRAVAAVFEHGVDWYSAIGSTEHPGTKLYTVLGAVRTPGLFEAPFGLTVRQVVEDFGGGMADGAEFGFALIGGAAGVLVGPDRLDAILDFPTQQGASSHLPPGTGAVLVCDRSISPVWAVRQLMHFFESESCGKCTPCRIGTSEVRRTLDALLSGKAAADDIARLHRLAHVLRETSFCGLGTSAAFPLRSALEAFPDAFEQRLSPSSGRKKEHGFCAT